MPILPLVDLFILVGTFSLLIGFILKSLQLARVYWSSILGFTSIDFVVIAGVCFGMALVLAARTWVKLNEPRYSEVRRRLAQLEARRRASAVAEPEEEGEEGLDEPSGALASFPRDEGR